jgi:hypothetical protein
MSEAVALFDPNTGSYANIVAGVLQTSATLTGGTISSSNVVATASISNVASSATSVTLLAANAARLGAVISNDSTANLFIKFGATASATSFTAKLLPDDVFVIDSLLLYKGVIDGIWSSANGFARVTELT